MVTLEGRVCCHRSLSSDLGSFTTVKEIEILLTTILAIVIEVLRSLALLGGNLLCLDLGSTLAATFRSYLCSGSCVLRIIHGRSGLLLLLFLFLFDL